MLINLSTVIHSHRFQAVALASTLSGWVRPTHFNEHIHNEDAARAFAHACRLGCEGIVSKRKGSRYQSGRSHDWLKMTFDRYCA